MGITPSKTVLHIQNQQREKQIQFLENLSQTLNKTPQEAEQITWLMQNKQYEIDYVILGKGGNGVVIRGFDRQENKHIAIKIIKFTSNEECDRLLNEFKLLQQCQGTQILRVKEIYISYKLKLQFMIMEFCPFDLKTYLKRIEEKRSNIKIAYVLQICLELVAGLKQIHENGIIHLDIKPANILFSPNSLWKYSDFGLSQRFKRVIPPSSSSLANCINSPTSSNNGAAQSQQLQKNASENNGSDSPVSPETIKEKIIQYAKIIPHGYTALYASPEQYEIVKQKKYDKNVTDKSDIYSLGIVFLELTGVKITHEEIQRLKTDPKVDITPYLNPQYDIFNEAILKRMLNREPQERPSLEEIQMQIKRILIKNKDRGIHSMTNSPLNIVKDGSSKPSNQQDMDFTKLACIDDNEIYSYYQRPQMPEEGIYFNQGGMDLTKQDIPEIDAATTQKINFNEQNIDFVKIK